MTLVARRLRCGEPALEVMCMTLRSAKLEALVGLPRRAEESTEAGHDVVKLVALVESAAVNSSPTLVSSFTKADKPKKMRGYRRIDWLSTGVAALAIVVAAGSATFTGVQMASASPADGALQILIADESALAGAEHAAAASKQRLEESIQTNLNDAALLRTAASAMVETEAQAATGDPASIAAATAAIDTYQADLGELAIPDTPTVYERGSVDTGSLESVGDAIDRVQVASSAVDAVSEELRATRARLDALTTDYTSKLAAFAASFADHAKAEVENYPVAEQPFRDAVVAAAASVAVTPLSTPAGTAALTAYRDAVIALHDDDYRARVAEEAARNQQQNTQDYNPPPTDPQDPDQPTDPQEPPITDPVVEEPNP